MDSVTVIQRQIQKILGLCFSFWEETKDIFIFTEKTSIFSGKSIVFVFCTQDQISV